MLPGFRFFLATIVLSASILIFGLGAAALLRATHEEFAVAPSLRTMQPPQPARAKQPEAVPPTLALLRVEIPAPAVEEPSQAPAAESAAPAVAAAPAAEIPSIDEEPSLKTEVAPVTEAPAPVTEAAAEPSDAAVRADITPAPVVAAEPATAPDAPQTAIEAASAPAVPAPAAETPPAADAPAPVVSTAPPTTVVAAAPATEVPAPAANAPVQTTDPSTRLVAVTATGCEILPSIPDKPVLIPAPRPAAAPETPKDDRTAQLETKPVATTASRPNRRKAKPVKRRQARTLHHRRHGSAYGRPAHAEIIKPQPQPDLFTILFGGGGQQPAPVRQ